MVAIDKNLYFNDEVENEDTSIEEELGNNKLTAYDIAVFYNTYNLSTLLKWWGRKLVVPDFQRSYVWNQKKASEFVDSILRGLPVPSLFFYDDIENNRLLVVDGQQRLKSLHSYIKDMSYNGKQFKLIGNIHPNWAGKAYDELENEDRDRLDDALMNVTVMRQLAPDDGQSSMYLAFQRINTGGVSLNAQEIRMAVSYGPFAQLLNELALETPLKDKGFLRSKKQRENEDFSPIQEFIVKFWAYYFNYPKYMGSSTRNMLDLFFSDQQFFDFPKKEKQGVRYYSKEELLEAYYSTLNVVDHLSDEDLSPYTVPTKSFLESIWVGLTYRKLKLGKEINEDKLPGYIKNWKTTIGEEKFSELFQARRTSSITSAYERIKAGIEYFSGDF